MAKIETALGDVNYTLTDATHVYLTGEIVAFSVGYKFSLHLYRQPDGSWSKDDKPQQNCFHNLYLSRTDNSMKDASFAARKKVEEVMVAAWTEHVTNDLRIEAEKRHLLDEHDQAEERIKELEAELRTERAKAHKLEVNRGLLDGPEAEAELAKAYRQHVLALDYTRFGK